MATDVAHRLSQLRGEKFKYYKISQRSFFFLPLEKIPLSWNEKRESQREAEREIEREEEQNSNTLKISIFKAKTLKSLA